MGLSGKHALKGLGQRGQKICKRVTLQTTDLTDLFSQHISVTVLQTNCPDDIIVILPCYRRTIESDCNASLSLLIPLSINTPVINAKLLWDTTNHHLHCLLLDSNCFWMNGKVGEINWCFDNAWREDYLVWDIVSDPLLKDGFHIQKAAQGWFTSALSWIRFFLFHGMKVITYPAGCLKRRFFKSTFSPSCTTKHQHPFLQLSLTLPLSSKWF